MYGFSLVLGANVGSMVGLTACVSVGMRVRMYGFSLVLGAILGCMVGLGAALGLESVLGCMGFP